MSARCLQLGIVLAGWLFPLLAFGHALSVAHVDLQRTEGDNHYRMQVDVSLRDLALTLPLDANRDERVTWGELQDLERPLAALVAGSVTVTAGGTNCASTPRELGVSDYDDGTYAAVSFDLKCASASSPAVHYGLFFDRDPLHRALVTLREGAATTTRIARADARAVHLATGDGRTFATFLREGVHHILIGYDHLAFLLCLLLPAALVRRDGRWTPAPSARTSLLQVLGIVTAFTVAHSITLTLAALELVRPASRWVEAAIAASVLLAALNNLRPVVVRGAWAVAFGFGLVHGFGFAGALGELGLPRDTRLASLLGFNLGVEVGQLAVVAAVLPLLLAMRVRLFYRRWFMPAVSLVIACVATWWLYLRIRG